MEAIKIEQQETAGVLAIGTPAPDFRLTSAQGPEVALVDYRGQKNVVLWFSRGIFCPFCRRYMTQLRLGYREIQERGAEILQVTWSTPEEARLYFQQYQLSFPYLCDPERTVPRLYGLPTIHRGTWTVAADVAIGTATAMSDRLLHNEKTASPLPAFKRYGRTDIEQVSFIIDKLGVIRYVYTTGPAGGLPANAEYLRQLESLQ